MGLKYFAIIFLVFLSSLLFLLSGRSSPDPDSFASSTNYQEAGDISLTKGLITAGYRITYDRVGFADSWSFSYTTKAVPKIKKGADFIFLIDPSTVPENFLPSGHLSGELSVTVTDSRQETIYHYSGDISKWTYADGSHEKVLLFIPEVTSIEELKKYDKHIEGDVFVDISFKSEVDENSPAARIIGTMVITCGGFK